MSIPLILPSKTFSGMLSWDISTGPSAVERNEWVRLNEWAESRHISLGEYPPFHFFPFILLVSASNHQAYLSTGYIIFFARYLLTYGSFSNLISPLAKVQRQYVTQKFLDVYILGVSTNSSADGVMFLQTAHLPLLT
jgi:hypothetical protein